MTLSYRSLASASALTLALCASSCSAPQKMSEEAMMAKWAEYATPSEGHKALAFKAGSWNAKIKQYMSPDAPPMEAEGHSEMKWVMGNRYIQDSVTSKMMGQDFVGQGTVGYDNLMHKYTGSWIDNMGTGVMHMEGTYDASTKTFTYDCMMPDLANGEYAPSRMIEKVVDNDHYNVTMWGPGMDGKEYKCMEIAYTRIK